MAGGRRRDRFARTSKRLRYALALRRWRYGGIVSVSVLGDMRMYRGMTMVRKGRRRRRRRIDKMMRVRRDEM